ncbi:hypothetical protein SCA6_002691 [Theobroma cacao]
MQKVTGRTPSAMQHYSELRSVPPSIQLIITIKVETTARILLQLLHGLTKSKSKFIQDYDSINPNPYSIRTMTQ